MSPISTSRGCSIAKAIARATASGAMANCSALRRIWARTSGSSMWSDSSVRTYPGEIEVVRSTRSVDSCRSPSSKVRTAFFVPA